MKTQELTPRQRSQLLRGILYSIAGAFLIVGAWAMLDQMRKDLPDYAHANTVLWNATFTNVTYAVIIVLVVISVMVAIYAYKKCPVPQLNNTEKSRSEE
jgi:RsiW-degrading membrane proteinase PrsW (M82 family)